LLKYLITILLFFSLLVPAAAQQDMIQQSQTTTNDTFRIKLLMDLASMYGETNPDSSYYYAEQSSILCRQFGYRLSEAFALNGMGYALMNKGNYPRALQVFLMAVQIAGDPQSERKILPQKYLPPLGADSAHSAPSLIRLQTLAWLHFNLGTLYENAGDVKKEMLHYSESLELAEQSGTVQIAGVSNMALGRLFVNMKKLDSALIHTKKAYEISKQSGFQNYGGSVLLNLGRVYLARGDKEEAVNYIRQAIFASEQQHYFRGVIAGNLLLGDISFQNNRTDSGFYFVTKALRLAERFNSPELLLRCYTALAGLYKSGNNNDSTVKYQALIIKIKDSLFNSKQRQQFQNIDSDAEQRQREIETAKKDYRNRLQKYALIAGLAVFLFAAIVLWRNNRNKQRAYTLLAKQKQETDVQKAKVEEALDELKSTQAQLVQREKMASLGELTAGVAHEIQNPLNFVNNFSEVNSDLVAELKTRNEKLKIEDSEINELLNDLDQNNKKISMHGKRAEGIVKGMLQHSKTSSGQREPTDINKLAGECVRLVYHGLLAKDKSFNAKYETDFDPTIGKINIVPQDIGRVLLNLINNAFYAVSAKALATADESYNPTVIVTTKNLNDHIEIKVADNGNGIPKSIIDKIFQPFFTTKPTGQGTGLGLSLAYEIVKAHGGEIKLNTSEGEGSEFIISLSL
jgi:signal transduction histidine kinase